MKLWTKIIGGVRKLILVDCAQCPCGHTGCEPRILASFTTTGRDDGNTYDLTPWKGTGKAAPGGRWRILETSDCYVYSQGEISEDGELVGLPDKFVSTYHYIGRPQSACIPAHQARQAQLVPRACEVWPEMPQRQSPPWHSQPPISRTTPSSSAA